MAKTPLFCTRSFAAVSAPAGVDVVSSTTQVILRPLIPPAALIALKRASIAPGASAKDDDAAPLRSVRIPILIVVGVMPCSLVVRRRWNVPPRYWLPPAPYRPGSLRPALKDPWQFAPEQAVSARHPPRCSANRDVTIVSPKWRSRSPKPLGTRPISCRRTVVLPEREGRRVGAGSLPPPSERRHPWIVRTARRQAT